MQSFSKLIIILLLSACVISCSGYREKFGGYKENHHIAAKEHKPLHLHKNLNAKQPDNEYSIPGTSKSNKSYSTPKDIESIQFPPEF